MARSKNSGFLISSGLLVILLLFSRCGPISASIPKILPGSVISTLGSGSGSNAAEGLVSLRLIGADGSSPATAGAIALLLSPNSNPALFQSLFLSGEVTFSAPGVSRGSGDVVYVYLNQDTAWIQANLNSGQVAMTLQSLGNGQFRLAKAGSVSDDLWHFLAQHLLQVNVFMTPS